MTQKRLIIIGAGGHAKVVCENARINGYEIVGILDDLKEGIFCGARIIGKIDRCTEYKDDCLFVVAIGDNVKREEICLRYDLNFITLIHPEAVVSKSARLGEGTVVMAGAVINADSMIGKHCIINSNATVEHDCSVGDFVHIAYGAVLSGGAKANKGITVGANAVVGIGAKAEFDILPGQAVLQ